MAPIILQSSHRWEVRRAERPTGPLVLDLVGLWLIESSLEHGSLRVRLAGPGRALVLFHAECKPDVCDRGQEVPVEWDPATGIGRLVVRRREAAEELVIRTGARSACEEG